MTTVESSVAGLTGEAYAEEKGIVPEDSKPQVADSTNSADIETKPEDNAGPVRTVTGIKVRSSRAKTLRVIAVD